MNVQFDSSPRSLLDACLAANRLLSNRLYKRSWLAFPYYGAVALYVGALLWLGTYGIAGWFVPPSTIAPVLGLLLAGFGLLTLTAFLGRRHVVSLLTREKTEMFGPSSVVLADDKLSYQDPRGKIEIPWQWVDAVEEIKGNIVIIYGLVYVIQLPGDAFPNIESARNFREEIRTRVAAAQVETAPGA